MGISLEFFVNTIRCSINICASCDQVIIHGGFAGKQDVIMSGCYTLQVAETQRGEGSGVGGV